MLNRKLKVLSNQKTYCTHCGQRFEDFDPYQLSDMKKFIFKLVSRITKVPEKKILEHRRYRDIVFARQIVMTILFEFDNLGCTGVAKIFDMDHSTVLASIRRISNLYDTEPDTKRKLDFIRKKVEERKREIEFAA